MEETSSSPNLPSSLSVKGLRAFLSSGHTHQKVPLVLKEWRTPFLEEEKEKAAQILPLQPWKSFESLSCSLCTDRPGDEQLHVFRSQDKDRYGYLRSVFVGPRADLIFCGECRNTVSRLLMGRGEEDNKLETKIRIVVDLLYQMTRDDLGQMEAGSRRHHSTEMEVDVADPASYLPHAFFVKEEDEDEDVKPEVLDLDAGGRTKIAGDKLEENEGEDDRALEDEGEGEEVVYDEAATATAVFLNNEITQIIVQSTIPSMERETEGPSLCQLRLVCRAFNKAVLELPHPSRISLVLDQLFACEEDIEEDVATDQDLYMGRKRKMPLVPVEKIPEVPPALCRHVKFCNGYDRTWPRRSCRALKFGKMTEYKGDLDDFPAHKPIPSEALNFLNFCSLYGSNILTLKLQFLEEVMLLPIAVAIDRYCPNLEDLSVRTWSCRCSTIMSYELFTFARKNHLKRIMFDKVVSIGQLATCPVMYEFARAIVRASPNLEFMDGGVQSVMFFDFSHHRYIKHIRCSVESAPEEPTIGEDLLDMISSAAPTLQTLKLSASSLREHRDNDELCSKLEKKRLPPMPVLHTFELYIGPGCYNYWPSLANCIINPETSQLRSLTIRSDDQCKNFMCLIRNLPDCRKETLENFYTTYSDVNLLQRFCDCFPNLKVLSVDVDVGNFVESGKKNLRTLFSNIVLWKQLYELDLRIDFRCTLNDLKELEGLGEDFWKLGPLKKLRLEMDDCSFQLQHLQSSSWRDAQLLPNLEKALSAMKWMEKVNFVNLVRSECGWLEDLKTFVEEKQLPISFIVYSRW